MKCPCPKMPVGGSVLSSVSPGNTAMITDPATPLNGQVVIVGQLAALDTSITIVTPGTILVASLVDGTVTALVPTTKVQPVNYQATPI